MAMEYVTKSKFALKDVAEKLSRNETSNQVCVMLFMLLLYCFCIDDVYSLGDPSTSMTPQVAEDTPTTVPSAQFPLQQFVVLLPRESSWFLGVSGR